MVNLSLHLKSKQLGQIEAIGNLRISLGSVLFLLFYLRNDITTGDRASYLIGSKFCPSIDLR